MGELPLLLLFFFPLLLELFATLFAGVIYTCHGEGYAAARPATRCTLDSPAQLLLHRP